MKLTHSPPFVSPTTRECCDADRSFERQGYVQVRGQVTKSGHSADVQCCNRPPWPHIFSPISTYSWDPFHGLFLPSAFRDSAPPLSGMSYKPFRMSTEIIPSDGSGRGLDLRVSRIQPQTPLGLRESEEQLSLHPGP